MTLAWISSPGLKHDAVARPFLIKHLIDRRFGSYLRAMMARRIGYDPADCAGAASGKTPGAKRAVELAHIMMQAARKPCPASAVP